MVDKRTTRYDIDDPKIAAIRKILRSVEPRKLPTETRHNEYMHAMWVCPYCRELVHKKAVYRNGKDVSSYGQYNMHFARMHATPNWKELQIQKLIDREIDRVIETDREIYIVKTPPINWQEQSDLYVKAREDLRMEQAAAAGIKRQRRDTGSIAEALRS